MKKIFNLILLSFLFIAFFNIAHAQPVPCKPIGSITICNFQLDPRVGGLPAPIGSIGSFNDSGSPLYLLKNNTNDIDWISVSGAQSPIVLSTVSTSSDPETVIQAITIPNGSTFKISAKVVSRKTVGASPFLAKAFNIVAVVHKDAITPFTILSFEQDSTFQLPSSNNVWQSFFVQNGEDVDLVVKGETSNTIVWTSEVSIIEVK